MRTYTEEQVDASLLIGKSRELIRKLESRISLEVQAGRDVGMSWAQIGLALGVSSQAAWERYGLTFQQREERSRQNTQSVVNVPLPGLSGVPDIGPHRRKRVAKHERGQADK